MGGFAERGETGSTRKGNLLAIMNVESNPPRLPKTPNSVISFSDLDFMGTYQNLYGPVVISVIAGNYIIQEMQIPESSLSLFHGDLVGFSREQVNVLGVVELRTTLGT